MPSCLDYEAALFATHVALLLFTTAAAHLEARRQGTHELHAQAQPYQRRQAAVLHGRRELHPAATVALLAQFTSSNQVCKILNMLLRAYSVSCLNQLQVTASQTSVSCHDGVLVCPGTLKHVWLLTSHDWQLAVPHLT